MSDVPFYLTRAGRTYYEHTMPELVRQLAALNETLTRLAERLEPESKPQGHPEVEPEP